MFAPIIVRVIPVIFGLLTKDVSNQNRFRLACEHIGNINLK